MEKAVIYLFLWRKFCHFPIQRSPKKHGQGHFFAKFHHISMKKIMKWPRFLEDLGR
jgi:hypothetical protein